MPFCSNLKQTNSLHKLDDAVRSGTIAELLAIVFDLWDLKSYFSGFFIIHLFQLTFKLRQNWEKGVFFFFFARLKDVDRAVLLSSMNMGEM